MDARMNRKGFVAMTGAASLTAFLAACGGGSDSGSSSAAGGSVAATSFDPATEPDAPLEVFTWAGYDDSPKDGLPAMWQQYKDGAYGTKSPLKFTLLDDDTQALAKVASGFSPDIIHPCGGYVTKWKEAGLIQPLDTSLLPDWTGVPESLKAPGKIDGAYYHMPFDTGFSCLAYDADVVDFSQVGGQETWKIMLDDRYKGKMTTFRGPDEIIEIASLINRGAKDPTVLTTDELAAAKETAMKIKANLRNFWTSENDAPEDEGPQHQVHAARRGAPGLGVRHDPQRREQTAGSRHDGDGVDRHAPGRRGTDQRLRLRLRPEGRREQADNGQGDRRGVRPRRRHALGTTEGMATEGGRAVQGVHLRRPGSHRLLAVASREIRSGR